MSYHWNLYSALTAALKHYGIEDTPDNRAGLKRKLMAHLALARDGAGSGWLFRPGSLEKTHLPKIFACLFASDC